MRQSDKILPLKQSTRPRALPFLKPDYNITMSEIEIGRHISLLVVLIKSAWKSFKKNRRFLKKKVSSGRARSDASEGRIMHLRHEKLAAMLLAIAIISKKMEDPKTGKKLKNCKIDESLTSTYDIYKQVTISLIDNLVKTDRKIV